MTAPISRRAFLGVAVAVTALPRLAPRKRQQPLLTSPTLATSPTLLTRG